MATVTKAKAEKVLAEVKRVYAAWFDGDEAGPQLIEEWVYPDNPIPWAIVWEEGPFEWAYLVTGGGVEEEFGFRVEPIKQPAGVFCEPYSAWALAIYPA